MVNTGDVRDAGSIPGLARSPGGGNGNPLQYSRLENPMGRDTQMWPQCSSSQGFHGEAHTGVPHKVAHDQVSAS